MPSPGNPHPSSNFRKMVSRRIGILGIFLVMVLLISSEVAAARELIETTSNKASDKETEKANPDPQQLCCDCGINHCHSCCTYPSEKVA